MIIIPFKTGTSFTLTCFYEVDDVATPLPPGIRSQLRTADDRLVYEFIVNRIDEVGGAFELECDNPAVWRAGMLYTDIEYTYDNGKVSKTDTFALSVEKAITHD